MCCAVRCGAVRQGGAGRGVAWCGIICILSLVVLFIMFGMFFVVTVFLIMLVSSYFVCIYVSCVCFYSFSCSCNMLSGDTTSVYIYII